MAQELQGLLDKIHQEGIKKADSEKERILAEAKAEAAQIRKQGQDEADALRRKAEADAAGMEARARAAIQQAARDIILAFKDDLKTRLQRLVKGVAAEALNAAFMGRVMLEMVKNQPDTDAKLEVLVARPELDKLVELCRTSLINDFKTAPEIRVGQGIAAGLKLNFGSGDVYFDFTDEAVTALISAYIGPRLAALLEPEAKA